jgi:hypothetical protein
MVEIIEKLKSAIKSFEKDNGPLLICALFLRDDPFGKWDIVLAASWLNPTEMHSYKILSAKLKDFLTDSELVQFSHIVILDQHDPTILFLLDLDTIKNGGYKELSSEILSEKFGFTIKKAYLLRSQKLS